jgi:hypothetical protein
MSSSFASASQWLVRVHHLRFRRMLVVRRGSGKRINKDDVTASPKQQIDGVMPIVNDMSGNSPNTSSMNAMGGSGGGGEEDMVTNNSTTNTDAHTSAPVCKK